MQRVAGAADEIDAFLDLDGRGVDERLDLLGGIRRTLGQFAHFLGNDRKALARFTRTRGFDTGVQRQQVGLERDLVDDADDARDLGGGLLDPVHRGDRLAHDIAGAFRILAGVVDVVGGRAGIVGAGIDLRGQLVQGRSRFFEARRLLFRSLGQIRRAAADLAGAGADIDDAEVHRRDGFFKGSQRRVEVLLQLAVFAREFIGNAVAEIALRQFRQAGADDGHDVPLQRYRLLAFAFRTTAFVFRFLALALGFCFETAAVGERMAEAFERLGNRARFVRAILADDRLLIAAFAQHLDAGDEATERLLHEGADGEVERQHDGCQNNDACDDHHEGLVLHRRVDRAVRHVDEDDPVGVHVRQRKGIDHAVELLAAIDREVLDDGRRKRREAGLDRIGTFTLVGLHRQILRRRDDPVAALRKQGHAAGAEGMQAAELVGERLQRNVDAADADHLAAGHDRVADGGHRGVFAGGAFSVRRGDRALLAGGGKAVPFGLVVRCEHREREAAILLLGPIGVERAVLVRAEIRAAGKRRRLAVERIRFFAEPAAEGELVALDIGLQHIDDRLAIQILAFVAAADDAGHGARGARKFADRGRDFVGDGLRL